MGDNTMLAQALCKNYHLHSGPARCAFKIDIRKAFDTLNWHFLFSTLERMRFPLVFINWIKACVTTCMLLFKVNGALEGYFAANQDYGRGTPYHPTCLF